MQAISQWTIPPATIRELTALYTYAEALLEDPLATREVYSCAVTCYMRQLEYFHIVLPGWTDRFTFLCTDLHLKGVKALFHRVNCQVLQILAHKEMCNLPCCCNCPGAYANIECLKPILGQVIPNPDATLAN